MLSDLTDSIKPETVFVSFYLSKTFSSITSLLGSRLLANLCTKVTARRFVVIVESAPQPPSRIILPLSAIVSCVTAFRPLQMWP